MNSFLSSLSFTSGGKIKQAFCFKYYNYKNKGMKISFDSIFFIVFGVISLIAGILKKNLLFWITVKYDGLENLLGANYIQVINLLFGIMSIIIGLYLLKN